MDDHLKFIFTAQLQHVFHRQLPYSVHIVQIRQQYSVQIYIRKSISSFKDQYRLHTVRIFLRELKCQRILGITVHQLQCLKFIVPPVRIFHQPLLKQGRIYRSRNSCIIYFFLIELKLPVPVQNDSAHTVFLSQLRSRCFSADSDSHFLIIHHCYYKSSSSQGQFFQHCQSPPECCFFLTSGHSLKYL